MAGPKAGPSPAPKLWEAEFTLIPTPKTVWKGVQLEKEALSKTEQVVAISGQEQNKETVTGGQVDANMVIDQ